MALAQSPEKIIVREDAAALHRGDRVKIEPDSTQSGDLKIALPSLAPGARIKRVSLQVTGAAYHGLLKNLSGVNVSKSPVVYDSAGAQNPSVSGQQAFIVDFTGIRAVLGLQMKSGGAITLALPWMGTEFSAKSAYPAPGGGPNFKPVPDASGKTSVGFAAIETTKLLVQIKFSGGALTVEQFVNDCRIMTGVFPSNLKVSVSGRPPFFTRPGVLNGPADVAGLAEDLNALMASATASIAPQITIATDTPGVLLPDFDAAHDLEVEQSAAARFGGQSSQDADMKALTPQTISLVFPATSNATWKLGRLELELAGQFPVWRAFSAQSAEGAGALHLGLRVNAQFSVARRIVFGQETELYGFSLLFRQPAEAAQLHLEVAEDQDGQPRAGQPVASADVTVPADSGGASVWVDALFPTAARISGQKNMWLVLRAKTGSVEWAGSAFAPSESFRTLLNNQGGDWQEYPLVDGQAAVALTRILRKPFPQENQPLLTLKFMGRSVQADLVSGSADVAVSFDSGKEPHIAASAPQTSLSIDVTALSSGKLTLRKARAFYQ